MLEALEASTFTRRSSFSCFFWSFFCLRPFTGFKIRCREGRGTEFGKARIEGGVKAVGLALETARVVDPMSTSVAAAFVAREGERPESKRLEVDVDWPPLDQRVAKVLPTRAFQPMPASKAAGDGVRRSWSSGVFGFLKQRGSAAAGRRRDEHASQDEDDTRCNTGFADQGHAPRTEAPWRGAAEAASTGTTPTTCESGMSWHGRWPLDKEGDVEHGAGVVDAPLSSVSTLCDGTYSASPLRASVFSSSSSPLSFGASPLPTVPTDLIWGRRRDHWDNVGEGDEVLSHKKFLVECSRDCHEQTEACERICNWAQAGLQHEDALQAQERNAADSEIGLTDGTDPLSLFCGDPLTCTIRRYVLRMIKYGKCSMCNVIIGFLYLERIKRDYPSLTLSSRTFQRLLLTAIMVATKQFDDIYYSNKHWAQIGELAPLLMNQLELRFLGLLNFACNVKREEYDEFVASLQVPSNAAASTPTWGKPGSFRQPLLDCHRPILSFTRRQCRLLPDRLGSQSLSPSLSPAASTSKPRFTNKAIQRISGKLSPSSSPSSLVRSRSSPRALLFPDPVRHAYAGSPMGTRGAVKRLHVSRNALPLVASGSATSGMLASSFDSAPSRNLRSRSKGENANVAAVKWGMNILDFGRAASLPLSKR